jgi:two-component system, chemotaxis family, chemotaxis protein CheY
MRFLIVEDDFTSRLMLQRIVKPYAQCDLAVNGEEAVQAFKMAHEEGQPYDLVLMDIMMPIKDGQQALMEIREFERSQDISPKDEVRVIMLTALGDPKNVVDAYYKGGASSYLVKPIDKGLLLEVIRNTGLRI